MPWAWTSRAHSPTAQTMQGQDFNKEKKEKKKYQCKKAQSGGWKTQNSCPLGPQNIPSIARCCSSWDKSRTTHSRSKLRRQNPRRSSDPGRSNPLRQGSDHFVSTEAANARRRLQQFPSGQVKSKKRCRSLPRSSHCGGPCADISSSK